jgi:hypothetical protein
MKTTILIFCFCLLLATAAFGQYGGTINSQPQFYQPPDHPAHASYSPMATERSVVGGTGYAMGQGDRLPSDFPQKPQASLGDVARELRKQHEQVKKARVVWSN